MKMYKLFQKIFKPKKCEWLHKSIICPRCGAIAFTENDTPKWMTKGHCFRCGKHLSWDTGTVLEVENERR